MPRDPRLDPQNGDVVRIKHRGTGEFETITVANVYATDYDVDIDILCENPAHNGTLGIIDWWRMNGVIHPELDLERIDDKWLVRLTGKEHEYKRPHELKFICESVAHIVERFNIRVVE